MGWAQRAREAAEDVTGTTLYDVKRWTAFDWTWPEDKEAARKLKKDRDGHLERAASMMTRKLRQHYGEENSVKLVHVKREPQLLFELQLSGLDEANVRQRAAYRMGRALSVKVPTGQMVPRVASQRSGGLRVGGHRREAVILSPPMGKWEIAVAAGRRKRLAAVAED